MPECTSMLVTQSSRKGRVYYSHFSVHRRRFEALKNHAKDGRGRYPKSRRICPKQKVLDTFGCKIIYIQIVSICTIRSLLSNFNPPSSLDKQLTSDLDYTSLKTRFGSQAALFVVLNGSLPLPSDVRLESSSSVWSFISWRQTNNVRRGQNM